KAQEQKAEAEGKIAARQEQEKQTGQKPRGRAPQVHNPEQAKPESSAQRNFTDPESRIMPDGGHKGSFLQAYNAQAAVDSAAQIVEPVFGYIKEGRGFRRFSFRGLGNVRSEWRLICGTHNLLKLFRSGWKMQLLRS